MVAASIGATLESRCDRVVIGGISMKIHHNFPFLALFFLSMMTNFPSQFTWGVMKTNLLYNILFAKTSFHICRDYSFFCTIQHATIKFFIFFRRVFTLCEAYLREKPVHPIPPNLSEKKFGTPSVRSDTDKVFALLLVSPSVVAGTKLYQLGRRRGGKSETGEHLSTLFPRSDNREIRQKWESHNRSRTDFAAYRPLSRNMLCCHSKRIPSREG